MDGCRHANRRTHNGAHGLAWGCQQVSSTPVTVQTPGRQLGTRAWTPARAPATRKQWVRVRQLQQPVGGKSETAAHIVTQLSQPLAQAHPLWPALGRLAIQGKGRQAPPRRLIGCRQ